MNPPNSEASQRPQEERHLEAVGVTGHQSLPPAAVTLLHDRLASLFDRDRTRDEVRVICSLASGADSTVAEFLLGLGAKLRAVIPCEGYEKTFNDEASRRSFARLLKMASSVEVLPFPSPSEDAFFAAGQQVLDEAEWLIAVWDGQPARGHGGTADIVELARAKGKRVEVIWPDGLRR